MIVGIKNKEYGFVLNVQIVLAVTAVVRFGNPILIANL